MKKSVALLFTFVMILSTISFVQAGHKGKHKSKELKLGVDVVLSSEKKLLKGKRVGLITNPTGVDQELNSIVDRFYNDKDINLTALYGPEHGVRGDAQAGSYVDFYIDEATGLPVYSLYGKTRKPTPEMLENVDVLVFDIQDVGTRFYTYIYTMALAMEAAKEKGIPFVVLDRPNPLGGLKVEGPILEAPEYASFIGQYAIPLRHGMTVGELAKLFNKEFGIGADLNVVKMKNWKRYMNYDDTGLEWVLPSPNMPTLDTAYAYPGTGLIEGTNLSEGRGTTKPFELLGAPFINGADLARELNKLKLKGVEFRAASFTPTFSKHSGVLSHGIQVHITDYDDYVPLETGLHIVKTIHDMYPDDFEFRAEDSKGISFFDLLIGNGWVRDDIEAGKSVKQIKQKWDKDSKEFLKVRSKYLLY
ncbi:exo-beta-N-acetylmuramidase NamZ family protein [Pradoshia sp.]